MVGNEKQLKGGGRLKLGHIFDYSTVVGVIFFFLFNALCALAGIYLTVTLAFAGFFRRNTSDEITWMIVLLICNLLVNFLSARKSPKKWRFIMGGPFITIGGTILYWLFRNNF